MTQCWTPQYSYTAGTRYPQCADCNDSGLIVRADFIGYCYCPTGAMRLMGDQPPRYDLTPED